MDLNELLSEEQEETNQTPKGNLGKLRGNFPPEGTWATAKWPVGMFPPKDENDILTVLVVATFQDKDAALILLPDVSVTHKVDLPHGSDGSKRTWTHTVTTAGGGRFGMMVVPLSEVEFLLEEGGE